MLFRPDAAADGGIVGVGHRGHGPLTGTEETGSPPLGKHGHGALFQIVESEPVAHDDHDALRNALRQRRRAQQEGSRGKELATIR